MFYRKTHIEICWEYLNVQGIKHSSNSQEIRRKGESDPLGELFGAAK